MINLNVFGKFGFSIDNKNIEDSFSKLINKYFVEDNKIIQEAITLLLKNYLKDSSNIEDSHNNKDSDSSEKIKPEDSESLEETMKKASSLVEHFLSDDLVWCKTAPDTQTKEASGGSDITPEGSRKVVSIGNDLAGNYIPNDHDLVLRDPNYVKKELDPSEKLKEELELDAAKKAMDQQLDTKKVMKEVSSQTSSLFNGIFDYIVDNTVDDEENAEARKKFMDDYFKDTLNINDDEKEEGYFKTLMKKIVCTNKENAEARKDFEDDCFKDTPNFNDNEKEKEDFKKLMKIVCENRDTSDDDKDDKENEDEKDSFEELLNIINNINKGTI